MFKIPFEWMPGSWGLKGRTREIAKAEYELTGYDLEKRLLEIAKDDMEPSEFSRRCWDLDVKYGKMDTAKYHRLLLTLIEDDRQRELAALELDQREGKIGSLEYSKKHATLKNEPWVNVVSMDFGGKTALEGSFELDWNDAFVAKLKEAGYIGATPDAIVNQWFMEVCRNVALEEFDGTGDFTADSQANLDTMKRWNAESLPAGRKGHS